MCSRGLGLGVEGLRAWLSISHVYYGNTYSKAPRLNFRALGPKYCNLNGLRYPGPSQLAGSLDPQGVTRYTRSLKGYPKLHTLNF